LGECASPAANVSAPGAAPKPTAYARSEFTLGWVKLSGDPQPILEDAAKL
jgi:hypothetical protein